jgi:hypothetical protein
MACAMARLYARGADLTKKMSGVAKTLGREVNRRRTKVSNLSRKVSNLNPSADARSSKNQWILPLTSIFSTTAPAARLQRDKCRDSLKRVDVGRR